MLMKSEKMITLIIFLLLLKISTSKDLNFCKPQFRCGWQPHTICSLRHNCGVNHRCVDFQNAALTQQKKDNIVSEHNKIRSAVATGSSNPGLDGQSLPKAADMAEMVWDKELEFVAQCWANQCGGMHDKCRKKSDGTTAGQNLAYSTVDDVIAMINGFYSEIKYTRATDISRFMGSQYTIGHFTQMAYFNSSQIGCARSKFCYTPFKRPTYYLVCNYAAAGNLLGAKIYSEGEPCSACSNGCSSTAGLCKTSASTSEYPDICSHATEFGCKPIMSDEDRKEKPESSKK